MSEHGNETVNENGLSSRAGLNFPVSRIHRLHSKRHRCRRVQTRASVYMAAVMEFLAAEILEMSGNVARENGDQRIVSHDVQTAVSNDKEFTRLLSGTTLAGVFIFDRDII